ncbi:MAG: TIR domain-containing protein [Pseudomonadota bacterium]
MSDTAYIELRRAKSFSNMLRSYSVYIDDAKVDKIKSGQTKRYALPAGPHTVRTSVDFYKSKPLDVVLSAGETLVLACGEGGPSTLAEGLTLNGFKQDLKSVLAPGDYLYVRFGDEAWQSSLRGDQPPAPPPATAPSPQQSVPRDFGVFISYRREDSRAFTGRISDRLTQHFGGEAIFRDVDSIPLGVDFRDKIEQTMAQADVALVIIGREWLSAGDGERRRLDDPGDFVRLEIESAMKRDIPVIPVLVDEATMPSHDQLPATIGELAFRNAIFIPREPYFHAGVDKVIEALESTANMTRPGPARVTKRKRFCIGCGQQLSPTQKFCTGCGRRANP